MLVLVVLRRAGVGSGAAIGYGAYVSTVSNKEIMPNSVMSLKLAYFVTGEGERSVESFSAKV
jgi:hypothetical protein